MSNEIVVLDFYNDKKDSLRLEVIAGAEGLPHRKIRTSEINRISLALAGFLEYYPKERIQILGLGDHLYLDRMSPEVRRQTLEKALESEEIPAVILAGNYSPHIEVVQICDKNKIPLFATTVEPSRVVGEVVFYLEESLSPKLVRHGSLVNVYGYGILIEGDSGIGKSECAMGLIRRGHRLVADDIVEIRRHSEGVLVGKGAKFIQNYMEVRGLGIIDVINIFGIQSVLEKSNIDMVIKFEEWNPEVTYERLGLDTQSIEILNISLPYLVLPVRPGRDMPILVEVAALNQHLKNRGINSANILEEKLIKTLSASSNNSLSSEDFSIKKDKQQNT